MKTRTKKLLTIVDLFILVTFGLLRWWGQGILAWASVNTLGLCVVTIVFGFHN